jgi:hypothetical protein
VRVGEADYARLARDAALLLGDPGRRPDALAERVPRHVAAAQADALVVERSKGGVMLHPIHAGAVLDDEVRECRTRISSARSRSCASRPGKAAARTRRGSCSGCAASAAPRPTGRRRQREALALGSRERGQVGPGGRRARVSRGFVAGQPALQERPAPGHVGLEGPGRARTLGHQRGSDVEREELAFLVDRVRGERPRTAGRRAPVPCAGF